MPALSGSALRSCGLVRVEKETSGIGERREAFMGLPLFCCFPSLFFLSSWAQCVCGVPPHPTPIPTHRTQSCVSFTKQAYPRGESVTREHGGCMVNSDAGEGGVRRSENLPPSSVLPFPRAVPRPLTNFSRPTTCTDHTDNHPHVHVPLPPPFCAWLAGRLSPHLFSRRPRATLVSASARATPDTLRGYDGSPTAN